MAHSRSIWCLLATGFLASLAIVDDAISQVPRAARAGPVTVPTEWMIPCDIPRDQLNAVAVAHNHDVYPGLAAKVPGGWLVYDRYLKEVIELDDGLAEIRRWGRSGNGPFEYGEPIAIGKSGTGQVVIVDRTPPSLIVLGDGRDNEYRILPADVTHLPVTAGVYSDHVLIGTRGGTISEVKLADPRSVRHRWGMSDFGFSVSDDVGMVPRYRFGYEMGGRAYVGFESSSRIWVLDDIDPPLLVARRCVPSALEGMPEEAPRIASTFPGIKSTVPLRIRTLGDFRPLPDGRVVALGALYTRDDLGQPAGASVELYDSDGRLVAAWHLDRTGSFRGLIDPDNVHRLLVWGQSDVPGLQLLELSGPGYPEVRGIR